MVFNGLLVRGFVCSAGCSVVGCLAVAVCGAALGGGGILGLLQLRLCVLSRGHAVIPTQSAKTSKRRLLTDVSNVTRVNNLTIAGTTQPSKITCRGSLLSN